MGAIFDKSSAFVLGVQLLEGLETANAIDRKRRVLRLKGPDRRLGAGAKLSIHRPRVETQICQAGLQAAHSFVSGL
jgi:hypothetical protein